MSARHPVITGLGIVSAAGCSLVSVWDAISNGVCGLKPLSLFTSPRYGQLLTGEIREDLGKLGAPVQGSRSDRLGWLAAREAIESSGLNLAVGAERTGLILGCSVGGSFDSEQFLTGLIKHGRMRARCTRFHECASAVDFVADSFGLYGPSLAIATACSSGALAIAAAAELIQSGEADVMLAGGTDSLSRMTWGGFHSLLLVDAAGCRPFDANRAGMCLGEGAAVLIIEAEETARGRGATILARLSGWGASCDAYHATAPHPEGKGAAAAMQAALRRAGLNSGEINYINAHGTGTRDNDLAESKALRQLFGERIPPFSSTKRFFGHSLAASGAIEAVICVEALRRQQLLPNPGFTEVDPAIGLEPVTSLRSAPLAHVLSNSFGFGGNNAALIFSRPEAATATRAPSPAPIHITGLGVIAPEATAVRNVEPPLQPDQITIRTCGSLANTASLSPNQRRRLSRMMQMALIAARRSQADSSTAEANGRLAVALGTGLGCTGEGAPFIENYIEKDEREPMPARFPGSVHNAPAAQVAIDLGARALNSAPTAGLITFECALWHASSQLAADEADVALAGAVDELNKYYLAIGKRWGTWNEQTLPGEGAVVVRLERMRGDRNRQCEEDELKPSATVPTAHDAKRIAQITALRLGRYRRPFDPKREAQWIADSVALASVEVLMSGANGFPLLDRYYRAVADELSARTGRNLEHRTYKQDSGEFNSASALGFVAAVELVRQRGCGVLLYTLSPRGGKALCFVQP